MNTEMYLDDYVLIEFYIEEFKQTVKLDPIERSFEIVFQRLAIANFFRNDPDGLERFLKIRERIEKIVFDYLDKDEGGHKP